MDLSVCGVHHGFLPPTAVPGTEGVNSFGPQQPQFLVKNVGETEVNRDATS